MNLQPSLRSGGTASLYFGREYDFEQDDSKETYDQEMRATRILLAGGILYVGGSPWFVYQAYAEENWLLFYRLGCGIWIPGCLIYMVGPLQCFSSSDCSGKLSAVFQIGCVVSFIVGCLLAFSGGEERVLEVTPAINELFLLGSACCAADALKLARSSWPNGLGLQNYMDLLISTCFMLAAILGGWTTGDSMIFGGYFWLFGSLLCLVGPLHTMRSLRRSRFAEVRGLRPPSDAVGKNLEMDLAPRYSTDGMVPRPTDWTA